MNYKPTIGMEIHAELKTNTKMFCGCKNDPDEKKPNKNVCPVCLAHPGTLPTINEKAVKKVLKTGLALNCEISEYSQFDRKNYFYPDLPKGYQISQYKHPLCGPGYLNIEGEKIDITRIHLEEDTGRLIHSKGKNYSLVDFNRAGIPLMELVTEPDLTSGLQARKFCEEFQIILKYLKVSDADMEKGQMRCEVNISLREITDQHRLGTKVEIKNLNSFKAVEKSIDYEIKRQTQLLDKKKKIAQETRGWDENKQITFSQRIKEEAHDYRYFPEPDLPPIKVSKEIPSDMDRLRDNKIYLLDIKKTMPELPQDKRKRLEEEYALPKDQIEILVNNKDLGEYFEKIASELQEWVKVEEGKERVEAPEKKKLYKLTANYLVTELQKLTKKSENEDIVEKITAENFAELIKMIYMKKVNSSAAQKILKIMYKTGGDPSNIAGLEKLLQLSDSSELENIIGTVITQNAKVVEDYKKGNENALQFLIGQVMKETQGQANPQIAQEILYKKLKV
ncbi:Asp-tRNA(Asn)/Glu-tRNA(Gln) amidotransferase subunit GatB [bacterium]|nr:MAG: Asp-tRNA(Asn)/Glu-tRNA(Gln) amidotransferase subunit GatB [bacterium]